MEALADAASNVMTAAVVFSFIAQFALKKILFKTWPLLNSLQTLSIIIIASASFTPANLTAFQSKYNAIVNFKVVP